MSEIKLIATDIDGTIMKHDFTFNPEIKDCVKKLTQKGVKVVLVTGRMHSATEFIAEELNLDTPIVSYQGGLIKDKNGNVLYEKYLDEGKAKEIIKWAKENDVHLNLYLDDKLYVEKDDAIIRRYASERAIEFNVCPFEQLELKKINKLLIVDFEHPEKVTEWLNELAPKYPEIYFVKSMPFFCEVSNLEAKKSNAVDFLRNYYGLKKEEIMTIGDQNNDIELLKAGGVKIAMGNATDDLKAVADYVTDTVNNNGFVKAVEKFVFDGAKDYNEATI